MVYRECDDCQEQFEFDSEDEVPKRPSELEDSTSPYWVVECCPLCGGNLFEIYKEEEDED